MHILIIPSEHFLTSRYPVGGIFQMHQAKALKNAGNYVGIISVGILSPRYILNKYKYIKSESTNGINILRRYSPIFMPYRWLTFQAIKKLHIRLGLKIYEQYIKEYGLPDIIHAHNFFYAGFIAEAIQKKYNISYILTEHSSTFSMGLVSKKYNRDLTTCACNSCALTAVSSPFVNLLKKRIDILDIGLLPNIVDESFFQEVISRKDIKYFTFLNVASLDSNKNQQLLIRAFAKIFKNKNAILKIAGEGMLLNELKQLARELTVEKQIIFLGLLSQKKVIEEMNGSDCFVLPSNYETFGVVLIEALACGLPLIATKSGGPEDIVNENNGILIDVGSQNELEDAMLYMYENIHNYDSKKLKEYAKSTFGEKAFLKNAMNYYNKKGNNGCHS